MRPRGYYRTEQRTRGYRLTWRDVIGCVVIGTAGPWLLYLADVKF